MKHFAGFLLCLLILPHADAQFVKAVGLNIGTTIANQSWRNIRGDQVLRKDYAQGTYASMNAEFLKGKYLTIVTEFEYAQKGCREGLPVVIINLPKGFSTYKIFDTRFNYFSSALVIKLRFENRFWIPYVFGGGRLDKLISYSSDINFQPLEKYMNEKIWGMDYGFGAEYKFSIGGVSAEFRHHYDFDNLLDVPYSDNYSGLEVKNNAYIFNIGIKYYFKNKKRIIVKPS